MKWLLQIQFKNFIRNILFIGINFYKIVKEDRIILNIETKKCSYVFDINSIENARIKLKKIISVCFKRFKNPALKKFIHKYSSYYNRSLLIKRTKKNRNQILNNFNSFISYKKLLNRSIFISNFSEKLSSIPKIACVYMIKENSSNNFYIGSSINLYARMKSHFFNSNRVKRGGNSIFYKYVNMSGGWTPFSLYILKETLNCLSLFRKEYPKLKINKEEILLLNFLSLYIVRSTEILYINKYKPNLNQYRGIIYPFLNFNVEAYFLLKNNVKYTVYTKDNLILVESFNLLALCLNLGISRTSLLRYINTNKYFYVKNFDLYIKVTKEDLKNKLLEFKYKENLRKYPKISGINLNELPCGLIKLDRDKKTILGKFTTIKEAALLLDNKKEVKYISRYINKEKLIKTGNIYCYFVKNPNKRIKLNPNKRGVILFDKENKCILSFEMIKDLLLYLGRKSTGDTAMLKKYIVGMNNSIFYKKRYKFIYTKEIENNLLFKPLNKFLELNERDKFKPIFVLDILNKNLTLYKDVASLKLDFLLEEDSDLYKYLYPKNLYLRNYQFIFLVDFYSDNIYKEFLNINIVYQGSIK